MSTNYNFYSFLKFLHSLNQFQNDILSKTLKSNKSKNYLNENYNSFNDVSIKDYNHSNNNISLYNEINLLKSENESLKKEINDICKRFENDINIVLLILQEKDKNISILNNNINELTIQNKNLLEILKKISNNSLNENNFIDYLNNIDNKDNNEILNELKFENEKKEKTIKNLKIEIKNLNEQLKLENEKQNNEKINEYKNLYENEIIKYNILKNDIQEIKILFEKLIKNKIKNPNSKNFNINNSILIQENYNLKNLINKLNKTNNLIKRENEFLKKEFYKNIYSQENNKDNIKI